MPSSRTDGEAINGVNYTHDRANNRSQGNAPITASNLKLTGVERSKCHTGQIADRTDAGRKGIFTGISYGQSFTILLDGEGN